MERIITTPNTVIKVEAGADLMQKDRACGYGETLKHLSYVESKLLKRSQDGLDVLFFVEIYLICVYLYVYDVLRTRLGLGRCWLDNIGNYCRY
jgi:hypothetical protein